MILNCKKCGKEFTTYPSKVKLGRGKYCSKECSLFITNKLLENNGIKTRFVKGQKAHNFKGYRFSRARQNGKRYIQIYMPKHPFASKAGYVREQRLIMEKHLGRTLTEDEVVHHKDGNTLNNDITNLELLTWKEHRQLHTKDSIHKRWLFAY